MAESDMTIGVLHPSPASRTLAKAAEKLGIPIPSGAAIYSHQCRMGRAAARMTRKQLAVASGVSERTITAFEHHNSRQITRANNVALRRALEAANVGFTGYGIEVPDRRVTDPPMIEVGPFTLRAINADTIEIMNAGEGGHFRTAELSEAIGRFVSERL